MAADKEARIASFEAFLMAKFGTTDVTKEQLLDLGQFDFTKFDESDKQNSKLTGANGTRILQPISLFEHYAYNHGENETILFAMFKDTGYAEKLCIANEDTKLPGCQKPWVRKASFKAFLMEKFHTTDVTTVTKEQLLSLSHSDFTKPGFVLLDRDAKGIPLLQSSSLYTFYTPPDRHGENTILFAMFKDTGFAEKLGITNKDKRKKSTVIVGSKTPQIPLDVRDPMKQAAKERMRKKYAPTPIHAKRPVIASKSPG